MSGLYNALFGMNPAASEVLALLELEPRELGRFRDVHVGCGEIAVYTRNGGGNRGEHTAVFERLRRHPCYLRDADDGFDHTYATIYFRFPERHAALLSGLDGGVRWDPDRRWKDKLAWVKEASPKELAQLEARVTENVMIIGAGPPVAAMLDKEKP